MAAWLVASTACGSALQAGTLASPGCLAGGEPATVAAVDEALRLRLSDGRLVQVAGVRAAEADRLGIPDAGRTGLASWLDHREVKVAPLRGEPDRWGRTVALVFAPAPSDPGASVSVGEAMLEAGLATADPDPGIAACWPIYLQLEAVARRARLSLLGRDDAVLGPADRPALERRLGTWILLQGRVAAVRDGRARTYVRFSDDGGSGIALALDHATKRRLIETWGDPDTWVGRRLLARGPLDDRWGLQIDVTSPEQISLDPP